MTIFTVLKQTIMKNLLIVERKRVERALQSNPNSIELQKELRVLTITINWL